MRLTPKEISVIRKLAEGLTVKEVAAALFVAPSTVVTHKKHIYKKTQTRTPLQLGVLAVKSGILTLLMVFNVAFCTNLSAQVVPPLLADINSSSGFATISDIESTFNNARRQEEIQLGLVKGVMKELKLPDSLFWNKLTDEQQMLFLINDERSARNGIDYQASGNFNAENKKIVPVCLPNFEGIYKALDLIAQVHADYLLDNNLFTHTDGNNDEPIDRFNIDAALADVFKALIVIESIAAFGSTDLSSLSQAHIDAIYSFIYVDLNSFSKHREMILVAKLEATGFLDDDFGEMGKEGALGIGIAEGAYNSLPFGRVFVIDLIDLQPDANSDFLIDSDIVTRTPCPDQAYITGQIGPPLDGSFHTSGLFQADAYIMGNSNVTFNANNYEFMPGFTIEDGSSLSLFTDACNN